LNAKDPGFPVALAAREFDVLRVLTYHRVCELKDTLWLDPRLISATPVAFARQMRYLAEHYHVVSMAEVLNAVENGTRLPRRAVLLTFDDAYRDFGEIAWPILKRYRLPVMLFVPTAYPDHPERAFWWDRLYRAIAYTSHTDLRETPLGPLSLGTSDQRKDSLYKVQSYAKTIPHARAMAFVDEVCTRLGYKQIEQETVLGWEKLRSLMKEGVALAAHTRTHPIMTQLSPEQVREEITGSLQDLRREIGSVLPVFSYPGGKHDDTVVRILKEEGFVMAFTTFGRNKLNSENLLRLGRTNITRRTSFPIFCLRLLPLVTYFDLWRRQRQHRSPMLTKPASIQYPA